MSTRTIYIDTIMGFGKYKGKSVQEIAEIDPGYFLWVKAAGVSNIDPELGRIVEAWAKANPKKANETIMSALNAAEKRKSEKGDQRNPAYQNERAQKSVKSDTPALDNLDTRFAEEAGSW